MRSAHRGVTIVELLIVFAIIGAILALAAPAVLVLAQERVFTATVDLVADSVSRVRDEALRDGVALELLLEGSEEGAALLVRRLSAGGVEEEADEGRVLLRVDRRLGVRVLDAEEMEEEQPAHGVVEVAELERVGEVEGSVESERVAVFLPTGRVVMGDVLEIAEGRGRRVRLRITELTGRLVEVKSGEGGELEVMGVERGGEMGRVVRE